ncbi:MAG TPA: electron transfer flavoprotein subunit alpha [Firmicutes bacterium]|nr:electron transfer flavoprotein subunit alpha [Bacillota bacterium]
MMLRINKERCTLCEACLSTCPFAALERVGDEIVVLDTCRLCGMCVRNCPVEAMFIEKQGEDLTEASLKETRNVIVIAEYDNKQLHPVTLELVGKGRAMADQISGELACVLMGCDCDKEATSLLEYGVDVVYLYDHKAFGHFTIEPYTNAVEDAIRDFEPAIALFAATPLGRSLAPRVAARFRTGLTADCTTLEVRENGELVQIRPAFGGDVMAQIITPKHRPQMATMRHKISEPARPRHNPGSKVVRRELTDELLQSGITVVNVQKRPPESSISDAEIIVACGRGVGNRETLGLVEELARLIGGQVGVTRPLVETGFANYRQQIGLSGRAVRPKLLITVGVSGAVQFTAGITGAETIVAIDSNPEAPIFQVCHYGLVGDLNEILPILIDSLKG